MKTFLLVVGLGISALGVSACSQSTAYAPQSASSTEGSNGYSSQMIAPGRYRVMFSGNRFTDRATVEDYLLLRAAELTRQEGYTGFTVVRRDVEKNTTVDVDTYRQPALGVGSFSTFSPYYGFYGAGAITPYDPYIGGAFPTTTVDVDRINRYDATATIVMYRGAAPTGPEPHFDASQVIERLRSTARMPNER